MASKGYVIVLFAIALVAIACTGAARVASQMDQLHTLMAQLHQAETDWSNEIHKPVEQYNDAAASRLEA